MGEGGIRFRPASVFSFLFRIYQCFGGWDLTKTDVITIPPPPIFLEGVAISPTHPPFSNLLLLPLSRKM